MHFSVVSKTVEKDTLPEKGNCDQSNEFHPITVFEELNLHVRVIDAAT